MAVAAFVCFILYLTRYQRAQLVRRALRYASGSRKFLRQIAQPPWGAYIYIYIYIYVCVCVCVYVCVCVCVCEVGVS